MGSFAIPLLAKTLLLARTMCARDLDWQSGSQNHPIRARSDPTVTRIHLALSKPIHTTTPTDSLPTRLCASATKTFKHRRPDGRWGIKGIPRLPYRLPELLRFPDASVFVCEGEKDANNVA